MKKVLTAALGILSVVPLIGLFTVAFLAPAFYEPRELIRVQPVGDVLRIVFGSLGVLLMLSYIGYVLRSDAVPSDKRGAWIFVLIFFNILVLPFFWYWYVRERGGNSHGV